MEPFTTLAWLGAGFPARSPDGAQHWPVVAAKGPRVGVAEEPTFTTAELGRIVTSTMMVAGDDDMFSASLYEAPPDAQLAMVPNCSHMLAFEQPELLVQLVAGFLANPRRHATVLPIGRTEVPLPLASGSSS